MKYFWSVIPVLILALSFPALAQTDAQAPIDSVTVTGQKTNPDVVIHDFIRGYAAPTTFLGKLARWKAPICPLVTGLQSDQDAQIEKRIREVAAMSGVLVNTNMICVANVEVRFTPEPQTLLNDIRAKRPAVLGFYWGSPSQTDRAAVISHPIQAWYASVIEDDNGTIRPEETYEQCLARTGNQTQCEIPVTSLHGADGLKSEFTHVLVVADIGKLGGLAVAPLADYVAMLALSQSQSFDTCKALPSISNLMAANCDPDVKTTALTDTDIAYLRALYTIPPDVQKAGAKNDITAQMEKTLGH